MHSQEATRAFDELYSDNSDLNHTNVLCARQFHLESLKFHIKCTRVH